MPKIDNIRSWEILRYFHPTVTNLPLVENGLSGRGSRGTLEADEDKGEGGAPPHRAADSGQQTSVARVD